MITSVANRTVRSVRKLGKRPWRERRGLLLCEGHPALAAALESGAVVHQVLHTQRAGRRVDLLARARRSGAEVFAVSEQIMTYLTTLAAPPDILSIVSRREATLDGQRTEAGVLLLNQVRDPASAGAMLLLAREAGLGGAIGGRGTADLFDRKTIRAARGAHFFLDVVRDADPKEAVEHHRSAGAHVVALTGAGVAPWDAVLTAPVMFVIDGEGADESDEVAAMADEQVAVAPGASVASRTAMLLYEWMRRTA